jgi:hypothetical protein
MDSPLVAVDVPLVGDERGKNWAKVVRRVDPERRSGWAFEGDFIAAGGIQDVPVGAVLLVYGERGSRSNPRIEARVYVVNPDGTLTHHGTATGRAWARTLRDTVGMLLGQDRPMPDLTGYPDQVLADELVRRGWKVEPGGDR